VGQGDYYAGMTPGKNGYNGVNDFDDFTKDFGDPTEKLLAHIISKVKTGVYNTPQKILQSTSDNSRTFSLEQSREKTLGLNKNKFTGMIMKRSGTRK
jgi:carboxyl-terminal processing protease